MNRFWYSFCTGSMAIALRLLSRWEVRLPPQGVPRGPLLVISNHLSFIDPPLLAASLRRTLYFMAKEELFHIPIWGLAVKAYGAFPVRRNEADMAALRRALGLLREEQALGLFPEGTRSRTGQLKRAQPGPALLALKAGVPILPVAITGSEKMRSLSDIGCHPTITVTCGKPFTLPALQGKVTRERLVLLADQIMEHIAALLPPERRGAYSREGSPVG